MSRLVNRINLTFTRYSQLRNILNRPLSVHTNFIPKEKNVFSTSSAVAATKPLTRHVSSDISDAEMDPILTEIDEICDKIDLFRQTVYSSDLPEIDKLNKANSTNELLEILKEMDDQDITKVVVCQTIIVLWDILRQEMLVRF